MSDLITIEDADASEIALLRSSIGKRISPEVYAVLCAIIELPQGRALRIHSPRAKNLYASLRSAVRHRWPGMTIVKYRNTIDVIPPQQEDSYQ